MKVAGEKVTDTLPKGTIEILPEKDDFSAIVGDASCIADIKNVRYAVIPLKFNPWSRVVSSTDKRMYLRHGNITINGKEEQILYYVGPVLGQSGEEKEQKLYEKGIYQAMALMKFMGIPVIIEAVDPVTKHELFIEKIVHYTTGLYKQYPEIIRLLHPTQLNLVLKITGIGRSTLSAISQAYGLEMRKLCPLAQLEVSAVKSLTSTKVRDQRIPRTLPVRLAWINLAEEAKLANTKIDETFFKYTKNKKVKVASFVNIGTNSMFWASQITGSMAFEGEPGSVKGMCDPNKVAYLTFKTSDSDDPVANAKCLAAALTCSQIVMIPVGLPVDKLVEALRIALRDTPGLLGNPSITEILRQQTRRVAKILLLCDEEHREMEAKAATELLKRTIDSLGVTESRTATTKACLEIDFTGNVMIARRAIGAVEVKHPADFVLPAVTGFYGSK